MISKVNRDHKSHIFLNPEQRDTQRNWKTIEENCLKINQNIKVTFDSILKVKNVTKPHALGHKLTEVRKELRLGTAYLVAQSSSSRDGGAECCQGTAPSSTYHGNSSSPRASRLNTNTAESHTDTHHPRAASWMPAGEPCQRRALYGPDGRSSVSPPVALPDLFLASQLIIVEDFYCALAGLNHIACSGWKEFLMRDDFRR